MNLVDAVNCECHNNLHMNVASYPAVIAANVGWWISRYSIDSIVLPLADIKHTRP